MASPSIAPSGSDAGLEPTVLAASRSRPKTKTMSRDKALKTG